METTTTEYKHALSSCEGEWEVREDRGNLIVFSMRFGVLIIGERPHNPSLPNAIFDLVPAFPKSSATLQNLPTILAQAMRPNQDRWYVTLLHFDARTTAMSENLLAGIEPEKTIAPGTSPQIPLQEEIRTLRKSLRRQLALTFADPRSAIKQIERDLSREKIQTVLDRISMNPERYGQAIKNRKLSIDPDIVLNLANLGAALGDRKCELHLPS
ncbi:MULTISPECIES: hypothetical protein [Thalassospira]|jgi:hypothetical protein|uniref:Uncharacterized protein n=1 Tax=Thalassospira marina TaxID=2048283 RepID=A0A2N3KIV6_9PROT|nr:MULTISPECIES: hypothetical protein [Thalassospira]OSQ38656.1 hypothetical protein THS27_21895 [Thalassospira sp. MCCC 1A01428]PKR50474.1 hypothetical protein COO20_21625 [Thalassospira marina]|tara:strand:+ start:470 stop:1108 length:639 start_codon:yes stop_codon:yes gene_type:complete